MLLERTSIKAAGDQTQMRTGPVSELTGVGSCIIMPDIFDLHAHIAVLNPCSLNNYRVSIFGFAGSDKASGAHSQNGYAWSLDAVRGID